MPCSGSEFRETLCRISLSGREPFSCRAAAEAECCGLCWLAAASKTSSNATRINSGLAAATT
eukprot:8292733-Heterocapsa_arctica.AAC.1